MIVLSAYEDPALMAEARQAGARAYLVKGCRASELVDEIMNAARTSAPSWAPAGPMAADQRHG